MSDIIWLNVYHVGLNDYIVESGASYCCSPSPMKPEAVRVQVWRNYSRYRNTYASRIMTAESAASTKVVSWSSVEIVP